VSTGDSLDLYFETFVAINATYQFMYCAKRMSARIHALRVLMPRLLLTSELAAGKDFFFAGKSR
jgi:hypothetical protein